MTNITEMNKNRLREAVVWTAGLAAVVVSGCTGKVEWPQWGGPSRNFMVDAPRLADNWPEEGPPKLWTRQLGDGFASIIADRDMAYTMYRIDEAEYVIALDSKTGKTVWEHRNPSPFTKLMAQFGPGPSSTPLMVANRLFTVGTNMVMHCFDKRSGRVLWRHDLVEEYGAEVPGRGYSCSPIAYGDTVILPVGGQEGQCVMAFSQADGTPVWKNQDFETTHSSPILINLHGEDQLVIFMASEIVGLNPRTGELLWSHPHSTQYGANLATPLWNGDELIFMSAAYDSGSRVIRLTSKDGKTVPEELWYSRKMRIHHGNVVRIGDHVYGSSGDSGPAFFMGMNMVTGKIAWRKRGFAKATCLLANDKLIILDEDGKLTLATASPEELIIHSEYQLTQHVSWTAPTLAGSTLYIRDRKNIFALDLN